MTVPLNYAASDVLRAANETADSAAYYSGIVAGYSGQSMANSAINYVRNVANGALSNIQAAAQTLASMGASALMQAAKASEVGALAQQAALAVRRAEALAGAIPSVLADAQGAAAVAALDVANGYAQRVASAVSGVAPVPSLPLPYGRSAPCNSKLVNAGGVINISNPRIVDYPKVFDTGPFGSVPQNMKVDRSNPQYILEINGKNLNSTYQKYIEEVTVYETCDHSISSIKIVVTNEQQRFADDAIWDRGNTIKYSFGYRATGVTYRGNMFISQGPKVIYPDGNGMPKIIIIGYGEEMRLGKSEERKTWINVRDSEIVTQIADKYGWDADVDITDPVHEHVAQVNESDWKFLDRRARYYGFQLFLQGSTLHFHAPRYIKSGLKFIYRAGKNSQLSGFTVWEEPLQHGKIVQADQIDPLAREIFTVTSAEVKDSVTRGTSSAYKNGSVVYSTTLSPLGETQPVAYMFEESHKQTNPVLGKEVEGFSQSTRWLVQGEGSVVGVETMRVGTCIEFMGLGRDSGEYYIKTLETSLKGSGDVTSRFGVARTWRGGALGSKLAPRVVDLVQTLE